MIASGWTTFKKHWKFIVFASIATAAVEIALQILERGVDGQNFILAIIFAIVAIIISIAIKLGWSRVLLGLNRHDSADFETFKTGPETWIRLIKTFVWYLLYFLMYAVMCVLPFAILGLIGVLTSIDFLATAGAVLAAAAFLILAIYFAIRYQFIYFTVLDYPHLRSKAVFKKAGEVTKKNLLGLLGFGIVIGLLNLVGLVCLVIGLIFTVPVTKLAKAKVYDFLKNKNHKHANHTHEVSHQN